MQKWICGTLHIDHTNTHIRQQEFYVHAFLQRVGIISSTTAGFLLVNGEDQKAAQKSDKRAQKGNMLQPTGNQTVNIKDRLHTLRYVTDKHNAEMT